MNTLSLVKIYGDAPEDRQGDPVNEYGTAVE